MACSSSVSRKQAHCRDASTPVLQQRLDAIGSNRDPLGAIITYERTGSPYSERLYRKKAQHIRSRAGLPDDPKDW